MTDEERAEEARALAYRQQQARRAAAEKQQRRALAGDPAALARLKAAWAPVQDLLRRR